MDNQCVSSYYGKSGPVISGDDWMRIKLVNSRLFERLMEVNDKCYDSAIALKLYVPNLTLLYGAMDIDEKYPEKGKTAHVIVKNGNWVYDNNLKMHFEYDDYCRIFNFEVYAEFDGPNWENFREYTELVLKGGFRAWCNKNGYEVLI